MEHGRRSPVGLRGHAVADKLIILPPNLTDEDYQLIEDHLHNCHFNGHLEDSFYGKTIHVLEGVTSEDVIDLTHKLCLLLNKCMVCGGKISYVGNEWAHDDEDIKCGLGDPALNKNLPPPLTMFTKSAEGEVENIPIPPVVEVDEGLDILSGEDRMRAIGQALIHGFGPEWLEKRRGSERGFGS